MLDSLSYDREFNLTYYVKSFFLLEGRYPLHLLQYCYYINLLQDFIATLLYNIKLNHVYKNFLFEFKKIMYNHFKFNFFY